MNPTLKYCQGSLVIETEDTRYHIPENIWEDDPRIKAHRALAYHYREIIKVWKGAGLPFTNEARDFEPISIAEPTHITPRSQQSEALQAWKEAGYRGTCAIPTGGGKTILAMLAIAHLKLPTLIIVPTIDLMHQWAEVIKFHLKTEAGRLGDGSHDIRGITVSTYASGVIQIENIGAKFGFLICDECHHLPGEVNQRIAYAAIAPFRLGLSATLERNDGKEELIYELLGPLVYEGNIHEMVGEGLSNFDVHTVEVELTPEEREAYENARAIYTQFIRFQNIQLSAPGGWNRFLYAASRSKEGRRAMEAYYEQKKLSQTPIAKIKVLWNLITRHEGQKILIFTNDNDTAYHIGTQFFLPVITHHTKSAERQKMLEAFRQGALRILVTSKVLNEGIDVPDAAVAIIVSGSGTVREHVQRLGRILREKTGKRASFYEIVSKNTGEYYVNQRRRDHAAYR